MPQIDIRIHVLQQQFSDSDTCQLGEALFFPEITTAETNSDDVAEIVLENVNRLLPEIPGLQLWQRMHGGSIETLTLSLPIAPAERTPLWRDPLVVTVHGVRWQKASNLHLLLLPSLGIEVAANTPEDLTRLAEEQIRMELVRRKATRSPGSLLSIFRCSGLRLQSFDIRHLVSSPRDQAQRERQPRTDDGRVLEKVADQLRRTGAVGAWCRDDLVQQLSDRLGGRVARSVLLLGASGTGKTAIFRQLAESGAEHLPAGCQFWMTSGSRLVSGMTGFGMWQERLERLRRELQESPVVLHLGSLKELVETGRSDCQTQGMAAFLRPFISRGEMLVVAECTQEELSLIERQDPAVVRAFVQLSVPEPPQADRLRILTEVARQEAAACGPVCTRAALAEIERLHGRFATGSGFPARQLRFLRNLCRDLRSTGMSDAGREVGEGDVVSAFSRETGLPLWILDDRVAFDAVAAERWFSSRVIGQSEAVNLTVSLLTTLKARLNREHRPLASLLLIGPTGVGKTELSKSLAEYMFKAADAADSRMIRIDMSEYADPLAAERLIGGSSAAEGLLTSRVREQPFSVILLDEFEKADPAILDLLLQVLGEGRLTDAAGRVADFRNAIILMTSNLGAATFGRGVAGFVSSVADVEDARRHFEREVRQFVRPELFNRIDRIVPFAPLDRATARRVVERQLALVQQREGLRYRSVTLRYDDRVVDYLLERGFEPRYGARSLKRVIERDFLAPLAEQFNQYAVETVLTAECTVVVAGTDTGAAVERLQQTVCAQTDVSGRVVSRAAAANMDLFQAVGRLQELRASVQRLRQASAVLSLESRIFRLEKQERRWNKKPTHSAEELRQRRELEQQREWLKRCEGCLARLAEREDQELLTLYGSTGDVHGQPSLTAFTDGEERQLSTLLLELLEQGTECPDRIRVLLMSDDARRLSMLGRSYIAIATELSAKVDVWEYLPTGARRVHVGEAEWSLQALEWSRVPDVKGSSAADTWQLQRKGVVRRTESGPVLLRRRWTQGPLCQDGIPGLFLDIRGPLVWNRFWCEEGVHRFTGGPGRQGKLDVQVFTGLAEVDQYLPPAGIIRPGAVVLTERCRDYDFTRERIVDRWLEETVAACSEDVLTVLLSDLLARRHRRLAEKLLD
ncbi:MAG: AAA family ATPase [Planctomycetota bacterium]